MRLSRKCSIPSRPSRWSTLACLWCRMRQICNSSIRCHHTCTNSNSNGNVNNIAMAYQDLFEGLINTSVHSQIYSPSAKGILWLLSSTSISRWINRLTDGLDRPPRSTFHRSNLTPCTNQSWGDLGSISGVNSTRTITSVLTSIGTQSTSFTVLAASWRV